MLRASEKSTSTTFIEIDTYDGIAPLLMIYVNYQYFQGQQISGKI